MKISCRMCDKGGNGLTGFACRVDYAAGIEDAIVKTVDTIKHRAIMYLVRVVVAIEINVWDFAEINSKVKKSVVTIICWCEV